MWKKTISMMAILAAGLLLLTTSAWAAYWHLDAQTIGPGEDFTVDFVYIDDTQTVDLGDVIAFSGEDWWVINIGWSHFNVLTNLPEGLVVDGLTMSSDTEDIRWVFDQDPGPYQYAGMISWWTYTAEVVVPIPGAVWLLGSGLIGIVGIRRKLRE